MDYFDIGALLSRGGLSSSPGRGRARIYRHSAPRTVADERREAEKVARRARAKASRKANCIRKG